MTPADPRPLPGQTGGDECAGLFDDGDKLGNVLISRPHVRFNPPGNTRHVESANRDGRPDDDMSRFAAASPVAGLQSPDQSVDLCNEKIEHLPLKGAISLRLMRKVIQIEHIGTLTQKLYPLCGKREDRNPI